MDTEKGEATTGSVDIAASDTSVSQALTIDPKREAKLLRKLDLSIAPIVLVIFLAAYLDRANIGNAASAGMSEDIGMSSAELGSVSIRYRISSFVLDTSLIITLQML
jgi:sugar phosphate permease